MFVNRYGTTVTCLQLEGPVSSEVLGSKATTRALRKVADKGRLPVFSRHVCLFSERARRRAKGLNFVPNAPAPRRVVKSLIAQGISVEAAEKVYLTFPYM